MEYLFIICIQRGWCGYFITSVRSRTKITDVFDIDCIVMAESDYSCSTDKKGFPDIFLWRQTFQAAGAEDRQSKKSSWQHLDCDSKIKPDVSETEARVVDDPDFGSLWIWREKAKRQPSWSAGSLKCKGFRPFTNRKLRLNINLKWNENVSSAYRIFTKI